MSRERTGGGARSGPDTGRRGRDGGQTARGGRERATPEPPWPARDVELLFAEVQAVVALSESEERQSDADSSSERCGSPALSQDNRTGGATSETEHDAGCKMDPASAVQKDPRRSSACEGRNRASDLAKPNLIPRSLTKLQWKKVAHQMKTDYFYSWRQCRAKYKAVLKEEKDARMRKDALLRQQEAARLKQERRRMLEAEARDLWRRGASRRQEEAKSQDAQLEGRFEHKIPLQVLSSLERKPAGRPSALLKYVARVWSEEAWDEETMKQFGRTCLYGYNILSFVSTEMHYDSGNKFERLAYLVRATTRKWELSPTNAFKGPSIDEEEGYLMLKVAMQCCARGHETGTGEDVKHHLTRAEIELGEHHPAVAQLLTMSLCLRLRLICREADQSVLRGTERCQKESDEDDTLNLGKMGSPAPTAAVTIQELAEKQEVIDPVRYSPSMQRGRQIRKLVNDGDQAVEIATELLSGRKTQLISQTEVCAEVFVTCAMVFAVAGAHWALQYIC